MDERSTDKKEKLLAALDQGVVMVHLDARKPGVKVPPDFNGEAHLRLNLSYRFDPPDLTVNDWGIRQTLSFSRRPCQIAVPWSALFAVTSHVTRQFWLFPEDLPRELIEQAAAARAAEEEHGEGAETKPSRGALRPAPQACPDSGSMKPERPTPPARGHLRVVK